jgi:hypothetical protein
MSQCIVSLNNIIVVPVIVHPPAWCSHRVENRSMVGCVTTVVFRTLLVDALTTPEAETLVVVVVVVTSAMVMSTTVSADEDAAAGTADSCSSSSAARARLRVSLCFAVAWRVVVCSVALAPGATSTDIVSACEATVVTSTDRPLVRLAAARLIEARRGGCSGV